MQQSRVYLPEVSGMNEEQLSVYERFPSNLTRALLLTKNSAGAHLALGATFTVGLLSLLEREVIVLRVAKLLDSDFERMLHYPLALKAGLTDEDIRIIEDGNYSLMEPRRSSVIKYVSECTIENKASRQAFDALEKYYSQNQIAEITHLAGHCAMTAMYLASLDIPLDSSETSWDRLVELNRLGQ